MLKKILIILVIAVMVMAAGVCQATQDRTTLIATTTLDDDPTAVEGVINIGDSYRESFFVTYEETEVGGGLSVAITMQISYDGTTWLSASFYDFDGGSTLQTSETLSTDGSYYCWFNRDLTVPQVKLILTATGSDVDDTADVTAYIVQDK